MGIISRWSRKIQRNEKYVNIFGRFFWSSMILAIGWGMLWTADTRFSSKEEGFSISTCSVLNDGVGEDMEKSHHDATKPIHEEDHPLDGQKDADKTLVVNDRDRRSSQILVSRAYMASYNKETKNPNWVSWKLISEHSDGMFSRNMEVFYEDERVPAPRSTPEDYRGSGYDRGHMCPAADNRWNPVAMRESFVMTNICPQHKDMNQNTWNEIEQLCRIWSREYGAVYIVCGPIYLDTEIRRIGKNKVAVPDFFFKVILRTGDEPTGIGFLCENSSDINREIVRLATIDEVETITGFTFFNHLPDTISARVKANCQIEKWRGTRKFIRQHNL